jgi:uncharacterized protein YhdP
VDPWSFAVQGEGAAGKVRWLPGAGDQSPALELALDHLVLKPHYAASTDNAAARVARPQALPRLLVDIAALRRDDRKLGAIGLSGRPVDAGYVFDTLTLKSDAVELTGKGTWLEQGERQTTGVEATINGGELQQLARLFGSRSAVQGGALSGELKLNWSGSPADFSVESLEGEVQIRARDGRLEKVDEGAGKLLNLFSLNSLQRRLSLDFSDIVKEGFSFNTLEGRIVLTDGDAFTNDFTIAGSSAIISIAGRTGLVKKDYDQLVTVTPQLSSSLPIAGAIAGGPAVGAAVFLAEKLVGKEFNRMTEVQYQVSGSWDNPVYEKLQKNRQSAGSGP